MTTPTTTEDPKRITFYANPDLKKRLKVAAAQKQQTIKAYMIQLLENHLRDSNNG